MVCGRDVSSPSLPGRVSCGSVGLQRVVVAAAPAAAIFVSKSVV